MLRRLHILINHTVFQPNFQHLTGMQLFNFYVNQGQSTLMLTIEKKSRMRSRISEFSDLYHFASRSKIKTNFIFPYHFFTFLPKKCSSFYGKHKNKKLWNFSGIDESLDFNKTLVNGIVLNLDSMNNARFLQKSLS